MLLEVKEEKLMCEVCKINEAIGVASCLCAQPMSLAYCQTCLVYSADALWLVMATVFCCDGPENMASWFWYLRTFKDGAYQSAAQIFGRQKTMDLI